MFDAYTGTYNDLCNILFYFRKLQAPHSALVCGATCGMHVFAGFVDKFFRHFRSEIRYGALPRESRNLCKMFPIYLSSIWHKAFDPPCRAAIYNLTKYPTAKSLAGILHRIRSAPQTQLSKVWLKTWKRFYNDGKCPLDGTWCQKNNCQSSYKGEITPEETDRWFEFPGHSHVYQRELPDYDVALCKLTKFPRNPSDCACSQHHFTEPFFPLEVHSAQGPLY